MALEEIKARISLLLEEMVNQPEDEHEVLEQLREAGAALDLVAGADVVRDVHDHDRHCVILVEDDGHPVRQGRLGEWDGDVGRRGLHAQHDGDERGRCDGAVAMTKAHRCLIPEASRRCKALARGAFLHRDLRGDPLLRAEKGHLASVGQYAPPRGTGCLRAA